MKKATLLLILIFAVAGTYAQNDDPYAIFGHKSAVKYESKVRDFLYIKNTDTCSDIKAIALDAGSGKIFLLGTDDCVIQSFNVEPTEILTWVSVDPKADKYPSLSPYNYCKNNPIIYIDPDGRSFTNFVDENGNLIQHIEDGSNAVFKLTGNKRSEEYFKFNGYDPSQGGTDKVNIGSAIKGAQDYTRKTYTSNFDEKGNVKMTYCNYGTMNIARTYESAVETTGGTTDISDITGSSYKIGQNLSNSKLVTPAADLKSAQQSAQKGKLVIGYWPGHVFTLNSDGFVNNVGAPRPTNNIFNPKYTEGTGQVFYIIK
jgi:hypothetical protein